MNLQVRYTNAKLTLNTKKALISILTYDIVTSKIVPTILGKVYSI